MKKFKISICFILAICMFVCLNSQIFNAVENYSQEWIYLDCYEKSSNPTGVPDYTVVAEPQGSSSVVRSSNGSHTITQLSVYNESFAAEDGTIAPYAVIGSDERTAVSNTSVYPYSAIVYIRVKYVEDTSPTWVGTGFLISENVVLTAAHCIVEEGKTVEDIIVYSGVNGSLNTATVSSSFNRYYLDENYTSASDFSYDYCIIELASSIGNSVGWFGLYVPASPVDYLDMTVTITGYPQLPTSTYGYTMYTATGAIDSIVIEDDELNVFKFKHLVDTSGGQSGSPVYSYIGNGYKATAIHVGGNSTYNLGRVITSTLFDWLELEGYIS